MGILRWTRHDISDLYVNCDPKQLKIATIVVSGVEVLERPSHALDLCPILKSTESWLLYLVIRGFQAIRQHKQAVTVRSRLCGCNRDY